MMLSCILTDMRFCGVVYFCCFTFIQFVTSRKCYYNCPMEGNMVDLSMYPNVTNQTVGVEERVIMKCPVSTLSGYYIQWTLATKDELLYSGFTKLTPDTRFDLDDTKLMISRVDVEHKGVYVCRHKYGTEDIAAVVLDVKDDPPFFKNGFENKSTVLGGRVFLSCNTRNLRFETMKTMNWTFNNALIFIEGTSVSESRFEFRGWSLTINQVRSSDKGTYKCSVNTGVSIIERVISLDIYSIQRQSAATPRGWHELKIDEGSRLAMTCESGFHPVASRKTNHLSHDSPCREHIELINTGCSKEHTILITNFTRSCYPWYRCEEESTVGLDHTRNGKTLNLPTVTISQNEILAAIGDTVTIVCRSSSKLLSKAVWMKDNVPITDSLKHRSSYKSTLSFLTVQRITLSDEGIYKCLVQNSVGVATDLVLLTVHPDTVKENISQSVCEEIHAPLCQQSLWYNATSPFPSGLHPGVTFQADLLPLLYSHRLHKALTPQFAKLAFVHCARHLPPCPEDDQKPHQILLPCAIACARATSESHQYLSYSCNGLPSTGPCTAPEGVVNLEVIMDPPKVEIAYKTPVTVTCRAKTNSRMFYMYFGETSPDHILPDTVRNSSHVTVTQTETDKGVYVLEAKYKEFTSLDITKIVCFVQTEYIEMEKSTAVKYIFEVLPITKEHLYVGVGENVTISCKVYSGECPTTTTTKWRYFTSKDNIIESSRVVDDGSLVMSLTVNNMRTYNSGTYQCQSTNCGQTKQKDITLIAGSRPNVLTRSHEVYEVLGGEARLYCFHKDGVDPNPHAFIRWKRGVEALPRRMEDPDFYGFDSELFVLNVTQKTLGKYTCLAKNQFGWSYQHIYLKELAGKPPLVYTAFKVTDADRVVIECTMYSRSNVPSFLWYKGHTQISASRNQRGKYTTTALSSSPQEDYHFSQYKKMKYTEFKGKLIIRRFEPDDFDSYTCLGNNGFGNGSSSIKIRAKLGPPKIKNRYYHGLMASLGDRRYISCDIKHYFNFSVQWLRNGQRIEADERVKIHTTEYKKDLTYSSVEITRVQVEDFANYTCEAKNRFGKAVMDLVLSPN